MKCRRGVIVLVMGMLVVGACVADDEGGKFFGIGAQLQYTRTDAGSVVEITALVPDSPAEKAGVEVGDLITHVDGTAAKGMLLEDVVELIRGADGTDVVLTITREGADAPMDITVTRGEVHFLGQDDLAAERAEGMARVAAEQAQGATGRINLTVAGPDGPIRVVRSSAWVGRSEGAPADMAVTETHVFVLRGHMLHQFAAEGMELVWDRDLRTDQELEIEERGITFSRTTVGGKLEIMGPYLYVLRGYMLHQFRLEDMEELAATDLRSDEEKQRTERVMQALP